VEAILQKLMKIGLTLSSEKLLFGLEEIMMVGQICRANGRRPCKLKVVAISEMQDCRTTSKVRRCLGAYIFYTIWIAYFAHIANPFYQIKSSQVYSKLQNDLKSHKSCGKSIKCKSRNLDCEGLLLTNSNNTKLY
jgi:hypothetical protein